MSSLRRLTIPDLVADPTLVDRLIDEGETLFVERKEKDPKKGLGPTVASFANTLGGWLLIGVDDDGKAVGYEPPGRADLQDYIRDLLRSQVDPAPPFVAIMASAQGHEIGVVRVAESSDTPHVSGGVIYQRNSGGKHPVREARDILELARRGEQARATAVQRQWGLELINDAMATPDRIYGDEPGQEAEYAPLLELVVRATPFTVSGAFADRALSQAAVQEAVACVTALFPTPHTAPREPGVTVEPRARGLHALGWRMGTLAMIDLALDAGGTIAVRRASRRTGGPLATVDAEQLVGELITAAARLLTALDGYGRAAVDIELRGTADLVIGHGPGTMGTIERKSMRIGGELSIPATDEDVLELAQRWARELARAAGIPAWEPSPQVSAPGRGAEQVAT